jgi:soluble cytochrome b562
MSAALPPETPPRGTDAEGAGNGWHQRRTGTPPGGASAPTPARGVEREPSPVIERGYVASLRWLVAEGDARGLVRVAVEIAALREALATLDETRRERDERARRFAELAREVQGVLQSLPPDLAAGQGLGDRLRALRDQVGAAQVERQRLQVELDAWRSMCALLTRTRAKVHELLESSERDREQLTRDVGAMRARVQELEGALERRSREAAEARADATDLRRGLAQWSGAVERALAELTRQAALLGGGGSQTPTGAPVLPAPPSGPSR